MGSDGDEGGHSSLGDKLKGLHLKNAKVALLHKKYVSSDAKHRASN